MYANDTSVLNVRKSLTELGNGHQWEHKQSTSNTVLWSK
jgi:hypothetical protein